MVMVASSSMVTRWRVTTERPNDRRVVGVEERLGSEGRPGRGARGGASRVETASLLLLIAGHEAVRGGARGGVVVPAWLGERCDPLARSWWRSGAGCPGGGPALGWAAAGDGALLLGAAGGSEGSEGLLDALGGEVALAEVADLGAGETVWRADERSVDLLGEQVAGGMVDRPGRGAVGVVPERERGGQVLGADRVGGVEQRVEEREPDDVCFGAGGELTGEPVSGLGKCATTARGYLGRA